MPPAPPPPQHYHQHVQQQQQQQKGLETKNTDYITLNENEIAMFKINKYKLYELKK
ncbi:hypothetical protein ABEB36_012937 [Hypothenemus hampei]|uniref:Uncharacterized protein n=1 Tax=Hypothenemus hampei TaxID=57062 RepID=A0ABD1E6J5_HYPHA